MLLGSLTQPTELCIPKNFKIQNEIWSNLTKVKTKKLPLYKLIGSSGLLLWFWHFMKCSLILCPNFDWPKIYQLHNCSTIQNHSGIYPKWLLLFVQQFFVYRWISESEVLVNWKTIITEQKIQCSIVVLTNFQELCQFNFVE